AAGPWHSGARVHASSAELIWIRLGCSRVRYHSSTASRPCSQPSPESVTGRALLARRVEQAELRSSQPFCSRLRSAPDSVPSLRRFSTWSQETSCGSHAAAEMRRRSTAETISWVRPVLVGAGGTSWTSRIWDRGMRRGPRFVSISTPASSTAVTRPRASEVEWVSPGSSEYRTTTRLPAWSSSTSRLPPLNVCPPSLRHRGRRPCQVWRGRADAMRITGRRWAWNWVEGVLCDVYPHDPRVVRRVSPVTYIIAHPCVDLTDKACIDECPVDGIYEGERRLYIHPDECVDCGACEPMCPVEAIFYEDDVP